MTGRRAAHEHEIPVQPGPQNAPVSLNRSYDYFADSLTVWIGSLALVNLVFPPFQIIDRLIFSTSNLTTRFIKKNCTKCHFFCCDLFYQYKFFKHDLNLIVFTYFF